MILAVAATEIEMQPFLAEFAGDASSCLTLVTGVGSVETAVCLTRFLCLLEQPVEAVVNFGIGGAYLQPAGSKQPALLDLCLAEQEVLGDFGISLPDEIVPLDRSLTGEIMCSLGGELLEAGQRLLESHGLVCHTGVFITVNGVSGTLCRGEMLRARWQGICENMEGAAVARVCREFSLPCLELRAVSNYAEDRQPASWRLVDACRQAGRAAALITKGLFQ